MGSSHLTMFSKRSHKNVKPIQNLEPNRDVKIILVVKPSVLVRLRLKNVVDSYYHLQYHAQYYEAWPVLQKHLLRIRAQTNRLLEEHHFELYETETEEQAITQQRNK